MLGCEWNSFLVIGALKQLHFKRLQPFNKTLADESGIKTSSVSVHKIFSFSVSCQVYIKFPYFLYYDFLRPHKIATKTNFWEKRISPLFPYFTQIFFTILVILRKLSQT